MEDAEKKKLYRKLLIEETQRLMEEFRETIVSRAKKRLEEIDATTPPPAN